MALNIITEIFHGKNRPMSGKKQLFCHCVRLQSNDFYVCHVPFPGLGKRKFDITRNSSHDIQVQAACQNNNGSYEKCPVVVYPCVLDEKKDEQDLTATTLQVCDPLKLVEVLVVVKTRQHCEYYPCVEVLLAATSSVTKRGCRAGGCGRRTRLQLHLPTLAKTCYLSRSAISFTLSCAGRNEIYRRGIVETAMEWTIVTQIHRGSGKKALATSQTKLFIRCLGETFTTAQDKNV